jgi:hypothetical protein
LRPFCTISAAAKKIFWTRLYPRAQWFQATAPLPEETMVSDGNRSGLAGIIEHDTAQACFLSHEYPLQAQTL